ncbi:MAG: metal-dependent hydrolase [Acidobacteriia bacterium]|nr:metal-dependent hydrolase [Terriglobia bacterium]
MDPITHGLASFAATRAFFPRASRLTVVAAVAAGTAADLDELSAFFGPSAYFAAHHTATHSLLGTVLLALLAAALLSALFPKKENQPTRFLVAFAAAFLAAALHLALDLAQAGGVALFWPLRTQRYALDWLGGIDPWILAILVAGVLFPLLLRLVTEEIGAKEKGPRGRWGALLALLAMLAYTGARVSLHASAVAALDSRTYRGQMAHRAAAFPEAASPFAWRGIVETESALHLLAVPAGPGASFNPEAGQTIFKPEPSAALDAARGTDAARRFLAVARFPKATVEKTPEGYRVTLRDLAGAAAGESARSLAAAIDLTPDAQVRRQAIIWERDLAQ